MARAEATTRAWCRLLRVPGLGPVLLARLLARWADPLALLAAGRSAWRAEGLPESVCAALAAPEQAAVDGDLAWLQRPGNALVTLDHPDYPRRLAEVASAPPALFCIGDTGLLAQPQLAMVGARHASAQGLDNARAFAAELSRRGLLVTSGLALGIDGASHEGALEAGAPTIAVCGNGLDRVYPPAHRELAHRIAERGLLLSEFPPGTPPKAEHFPRRNRIISGLALGVLVVEAARESGSLITARLAGEQGREVFAIPGSIHNPMARGCHQLIREGARLVETVDDILVELAPQIAAVLRPPAAPQDVARSADPQDAGPPDSRQARVLQALGEDPQDFDTLLRRSGLDTAELNALLSELELSGRVEGGPGGTFMSRRQR